MKNLSSIQQDQPSIMGPKMSLELKELILVDYVSNPDFETLLEDIEDINVPIKYVNPIDLIMKDIKAISLTNKDLNQIVNNPSVFTKLLHKLANTFDMNTNVMIKHFTIPVVKTYQKLGLALICACSSEDFMVNVPEIIKQGADINFIFMGRFTPLYTAVHENNIKLLKLLLDYGAKPILNKDCKKANQHFFTLKNQIASLK